MKPYAFFRDDGLFYVIELNDDSEVKANAECNPGTVKVENAITGELIWSAFQGN